MTILVRDGTNTQRTLTAIQVRDGTNTARDLSEIWVRDSNNVPRLVFTTGAALEVTASPELVAGIAYGSGVVTTNATVATPAGGTAPYTYAWTVYTHSNVTPPSINSPTSATTTFTQVDVVDYDDAEFICTVTDDLSATAEALVAAVFQNVVPPFP